MKKSLIIILIIIAIAILSITGYFEYQKYLWTKAPSQTSGWKTYTNANLNFSLLYPSDFELTSILKTAQQSKLQTYMGACVFSDSLYLEPNEIGFCYTGIINELDAAAINIIPSASTSIQECQKTIVDNHGQSSQKVTIGGVIFYHDELGDAGLGHNLSIDSYRTYQNGICYTINLEIEGHAVEQAQIPAVTTSRDTMTQRLKSILFTFKFTK